MAESGTSPRWRAGWPLLIPIGLLAGGLIAAAIAPAGKAARPPPARPLMDAIDKLRPLHPKLDKPRPGDWLFHHHEPGQTLAEYIRDDPVMPTPDRRTVCVQPLGELAPAQRQVVALAADFIGRYYGLPVKALPDLPLAVIPDRARRTHPTWGDKQILSGYVLDKVLPGRLPADGFACIAFTSSDLWPGEGWNFVFGQASLTGRVGVWSIYRFGDPGVGAEARRLCLLRTCKTAVHELGHMFSMQHCTAYQCVMNGSNSLAESDRRPLELCPECLAKACWATGAEPADRFRKLLEFCRTQGLAEQAQFYEKSLWALGIVPTTQPASAPEHEDN